MEIVIRDGLGPFEHVDGRVTFFVDAELTGTGGGPRP